MGSSCSHLLFYKYHDAPNPPYSQGHGDGSNYDPYRADRSVSATRPNDQSGGRAWSGNYGRC
jgi:hypothetical protein